MKKPALENSETREEFQDTAGQKGEARSKPQIIGNVANPFII